MKKIFTTALLTVVAAFTASVSKAELKSFRIPGVLWCFC